MPIPQLQPFTLVPHPAVLNPAVHSIQGEISREEGALRVTYRLAGELNQLRVPASTTPRFADELWRHTCFELFVALQGMAPYHEMNFSPSGEWAAYAFTRYRERAPLAAEEALTPAIAVSRSAGALKLEAVVPLARLAPPYVHARLAVAISTVVETGDGRLAYWALKHPAAQPDFHHPDAFGLEFDEIRN